MIIDIFELSSRHHVSYSVYASTCGRECHEIHQQFSAAVYLSDSFHDLMTLFLQYKKAYFLLKQ